MILNPKIKVLITSEISDSDVEKFHSSKVEFVKKSFIKTNLEFDKTLLNQILTENNFDTICISSSNSILALKYILDAKYKFQSIISVGSKTAEKIKKLGLEVLVPKEENVESMAELLGSDFKNNNILYLSGNLKLNQLNSLLPNHKIYAFCTYMTEFIQPMIQVENYSAIAFASYSAADSYFMKYTIPKHLKIFSIGVKTSEYIERTYRHQAITASRPDITILLKEIQDYFQND